MAHTASLVAVALAWLPVPAWLGVLLHPARPWDLRPTDREGPPPPDPPRWPPVAVVVPARNEAETLPRTLPALLAQDYPGDWRVIVVDDRSSDGTAEAARRAGGASSRLLVLHGGPVPSGWVGKVRALEQGVAAAAAWSPEHLLLTDADILHAPGSLRALVADAEARGLALDSRMARLGCRSRAERLLVPAFLLFFNLLYPMRRVNGRGGPAAAAGGCMLVRRDALERAGGLAAIRGALIDDLALAALLKRTAGMPVRLTLSEERVRSLREYGSVGPVWRMVRRSAFTQLRRSWPLTLAVLAALAVLFAIPPLALAAGIALLPVAPAAGAAVAAGGAAAWALTALVYGPSTRYFGLRRAWRWTLPAAGVLYGGMTLDSALRGSGPRPEGWQ
jgi:hopene-associated glycosyltransferase HpnB